MTLNVDEYGAFRERIWEWYHDNARDLPWRDDPTPYQVLVSEVMLQQTQVSRVLVKYAEWMQTFPTLETLAAASVAEVTAAWQGLGYNRRGLWLRQAAIMIINDFDGALPRDVAELAKLPGIGPNTAGSIAVFAYNEPVVFIETNIRRVFIHEFFGGGLAAAGSVSVTTRESLRSGDVVAVPDVAAWKQNPPLPPLDGAVDDRALLPLIEAALDRDEPRQWYYALMDYGSWLATQVPNPNRRSKHYAVQSKFEGSARQVRGEILRRALEGSLSVVDLAAIDERAPKLAGDLLKEGFLELVRGKYQMVR